MVSSAPSSETGEDSLIRLIDQSPQPVDMTHELFEGLRASQKIHSAEVFLR